MNSIAKGFLGFFQKFDQHELLYNVGESIAAVSIISAPFVFFAILGYVVTKVIEE